jgi:hypothetical protein
MGRTRKLFGASFVLVTALALVGVSPGAPAGAAPNFRGVASADAVRVLVVVPNFPVTSSVVDTSLYAAQAMVTSNNNSQAFASSPYPGEGVVTLPGTLAGFGAAGIPNYPLYAASVHPDTPDAKVGDGPFKLEAHSTETTSEATASSGVSGEQNLGAAVTTVSVKRADDAVVAQAQSRVDGFAVEGVRIGSVVSSATTKLLPDGKLERSSTLDVTGITVNDVSVRLTNEGLVAGDQTVPVDSGAINEALKQAGVSVTLIAPEETPSGILGAGVRIAAAVEVPGSGVINVSWTLGRSFAVIDSAGIDEEILPDLPPEDLPSEPPPASAESHQPAAPTEAPPAFSTAAGFDAGTPVAADTGSTSASGSGFVSAGGSGYGTSAPISDSLAPTGTVDAPAPAGDVALASPPVATDVVARPASLSADDMSGFFLLLVAGAAAVVVLSQVLGLLGVRLR